LKIIVLLNFLFCKNNQIYPLNLLVPGTKETRKIWLRSSVLLGPQFNGKNSAGLEFELRPKASTRALPSGPRFPATPPFPRFSWLGKLLLARIFNELTCSLSLSFSPPCADTISHRNDFQRVPYSGLLPLSPGLLEI